MNGTLGGPAAVVVIQNLANGGLCSGTLIAPRVVLTAKHCVQLPSAAGPVMPSDMVVGVGDNVRALSSVLRVQSVHTTPGVWTETAGGGLTGDLVGIDCAVMVTTTSPAGIDPIPVRRTDPADLVGDRITAVGFGETPSGQVGVKFTTMGGVQGVRGNLLLVGPLTCQGDSGGPAITMDNEVAGTVSFGSGGCGSGYGAYNTVFPFLDMIDAAITEAGQCLNNGPEVCDGADNDCNGMIDETCTAIGGRCDADDQCMGQLCEQTATGQRCTTPCDAMHPHFGCDPGFYCSMGPDCRGWCTPLDGTPGDKGNDVECATDAECASLFCHDPGDGRQRCLSPCRGDAGMCLAAEACAAGPGSCSGCVPQDIVVGTRGLGEECDPEQQNCYSGRCLTDGTRHYCTRDCSLDSDCGNSGYHCNAGSCVSGPRGQLGDSCNDNGDCATNYFCAMRGSQHWCTRLCPDGTCDEGFECVAAGGTMICAPVNGLVGDQCGDNSMCVSSLCAAGACTRYCGTDAPCGPGFECRHASDGVNAVCVRPTTPAPPPSGGGCSIGSRSAAPFAWLLIAIGIALFRRRRQS